MDETVIQEQLKQKTTQDTQIDDSYPETEGGDPTQHSNLPLENMLLQREVAEFLSLPSGFKNNPELVTQLDSVIQWAVDTSGSREFSDILRVLGRKQGEMGITGKPDKLYRIYQAVKISKQIDGMYERLRALNG